MPAVVRSVRSLLLAGAFLLPIAANADPTFSFGLWGDVPYARSNDGPKMPALQADMNASDIAFSVYDGDLKDGSSKCDEGVYRWAIDYFNGFKAPTVYVPGDNE